MASPLNDERDARQLERMIGSAIVNLDKRRDVELAGLMAELELAEARFVDAYLAVQRRRTELAVARLDRGTRG